MSKWQKNYGIDDEGHRTIVITENKPNPSSIDRFLGFFTRSFGRITVVLFICLILLQGLIRISDSMNGFITHNRIFVVVALIAVFLCFVGQVAKRFINSSPSSPSSKNTTTKQN